MDLKQFFIEELKRHYQGLITGAHRAESEAAAGADQLRADSTQKEDTKSAVELGRVARGHRARRRAAKGELEQLIAFAAKGWPSFSAGAAVALGALVDVSIEDDHGVEERTLFMLPVGAGTELTGPGGDGFVSVVTPTSPVGRALTGARAGDSFEIVVGEADREWTIIDVG